MKNIAACLFVLILCTAATLSAQTSTLKCDQDTWDFGTIKEDGGSVSHTFTFTNTGAKPLVIEKVATSCGCTVPKASKEPILPGKTGTVEITYDPAGRPGQFEREIIVLSNDRENRNTITITGNVTPRPRQISDDYPVEVGSGLLAERSTSALGYVGRGKTKSVTINCYNNGNQPLTLGIAYDKPVPYFRVSLVPAVVAPKTVGVMTITYDLRQANLWGMLSDNYSLTVNGTKSSSTVFSATGIATDDFSQLDREELELAARAVMPTQFNYFGDLKTGGTRSKDFTIMNQGQKPLIIRSVAPGPKLRTTLKEGTTVLPGESVTFTVTLDLKDAVPGRVMQSLIIILNDPQRPMREVRLAANIL